MFRRILKIFFKYIAHDSFIWIMLLKRDWTNDAIKEIVRTSPIYLPRKVIHVIKYE